MRLHVSETWAKDTASIDCIVHAGNERRAIGSKKHDEVCHFRAGSPRKEVARYVPLRQ